MPSVFILLLSDQFCSLVFTLSNLYFVGCAYANGLENWRQCTTGRNWGPAFALAALPLLVRFVQSIKRWVDSSLITHLINVSMTECLLLHHTNFSLCRQESTGLGSYTTSSIICGEHMVRYGCSSICARIDSFLITHVYRWRPRRQIRDLVCLWYTIFFICFVMGMSCSKSNFTQANLQPSGLSHGLVSSAPSCATSHAPLRTTVFEPFTSQCCNFPERCFIMLIHAPEQLYYLAIVCLPNHYNSYRRK